MPPAGSCPRRKPKLQSDQPMHSVMIAVALLTNRADSRKLRREWVATLSREGSAGFRTPLVRTEGPTRSTGGSLGRETWHRRWTRGAMRAFSWDRRSERRGEKSGFPRGDGAVGLTERIDAKPATPGIAAPGTRPSPRFPSSNSIGNVRTVACFSKKRESPQRSERDTRSAYVRPGSSSGENCDDRWISRSRGSPRLV
jgi:hypothetical protein